MNKPALFFLLHLDIRGKKHFRLWFPIAVTPFYSFADCACDLLGFAGLFSRQAAGYKDYAKLMRAFFRCLMMEGPSSLLSLNLNEGPHKIEVKIRTI